MTIEASSTTPENGSGGGRRQASTTAPSAGDVSGTVSTAKGPWSEIPTDDAINDAEKKSYIRPERRGKMIFRTEGTRPHATTMSEIDAKIAAAEARTDTKFAEMMGELRLIGQRLNHIERSTSGLRLNTWLAAATTIGLVVAIIAWGGQMFGTGMNVQTVAEQTATTIERQTGQRLDGVDSRMSGIEAQLQSISETLAEQRSSPPPPSN